MRNLIERAKSSAARHPLIAIVAVVLLYVVISNAVSTGIEKYDRWQYERNRARIERENEAISKTRDDALRDAQKASTDAAAAIAEAKVNEKEFDAGRERARSHDERIDAARRKVETSGGNVVPSDAPTSDELRTRAGKLGIEWGRGGSPNPK